MTTARAVGRNAIQTAVGRYSVLFVWFLVTPRILDAIGTDRFGFWSILLMLSSLLASFDFGLGVAVTRFVAEALGGSSPARARALVVRALRLQTLFAAAFALVLLALRDPVLAGFRIPAEWLPEARAAYHVTLLAFIPLLAGNLLLSALQGMQRMELAARVAVPLSVALLVGVFVATRAEHPLAALTIVQAAYATCSATALWFAFRQASRPEAGAPLAAAPAVSLRPLLALGGWVQFSSIMGLIQAQADKVLLGMLVALAPVAAYELGFRITMAALLPPMMILGALLPAAARQEIRHGDSGRAGFYRAALPTYLLACLSLAGGLVALAAPILESWLGDPPAYAVWFLRALALTQLANLVGGIASTMIRAAGAMRIEFEYSTLGTVLHLGLALVGLTAFGPLGLVFGAALGSILGVGWFLFRVERWLGAAGTGATLGALVPPLVATLLAGFAAAGAALGASAMEPGRLRGLAGLGLGTLAYLAVGAATLQFAFPGYARDIRLRLATLRPREAVR